MQKICLCLLLLCLSACVAKSTQLRIDSPLLKEDPQLSTGTLANGLRYFVRHNNEPKQQVEFRLVIHVGSLQEKEAQLGMAHFLEHMAFNGTKNFSKQAILDFFEDQGVGLGHGVNASTNMTRTIYRFRLLDHDAASIDQALYLLHEWASYLNIHAKQFANEKKIVLEENRMYLGKHERLTQKQLPFSLGQAYNQRPGGKNTVIQAFTADSMMQFYHDWYRPEHMAVVVVGNIQRHAMVKKIKHIFSDVKNQKDAPKHHYPPMYQHTDLQQRMIIDPEFDTADIIFTQKQQYSLQKQTTEDFQNILKSHLYRDMLNQRLNNTEKTKRAYEDASFSLSNIHAQLTLQKLKVAVKGNAYSQALKDILYQLERIHRHGFVASELKRSKQTLLIWLDNQRLKSEKRSSSNYATRYSYSVFRKIVQTSDSEDYKLAKKILKQISLEDMNATPTPLRAEKNQTLSFIGHPKHQQHMPSEEAVIRLRQQVQQLSTLPAYRDTDTNRPLVTNLLEKGHIQHETFHKKTGITELLLSNGVKVLLKPTKLKKKEVLFYAYSKGGFAKAGEKYINVRYMLDPVLSESGLGDFTAVQLAKKTHAKHTYLEPYVDLHEEGLRGQTRTKNIETLLQLNYLYFTHRRIDSHVFEESKTAIIRRMTLQKNTADWQFIRAIQDKVKAKNAFTRQLSIADIQHSKVETLRALLDNRFNNAADFTFLFVGDFNINNIKPLIASYLANLPSNAQREDLNEVHTSDLEGQYRIEVNAALENKSIIIIRLQQHLSYAKHIKKRFSLLKKILRLKLQESLREKQGLIYGSRVHYYLEKSGQPYAAFHFYFECAPENVEQVIESWRKVVDNLSLRPSVYQATHQTHLFVTQRSLDSLYKQKKSKSKKKKSNVQWANKIYQQHLLGLALDYFPKTKKKLHYTPKAIAHYARKYLQTDNLIIAILNPKKEVKPKPVVAPVATSLQ